MTDDGRGGSPTAGGADTGGGPGPAWRADAAPTAGPDRAPTAGPDAAPWSDSGGPGATATAAVAAGWSTGPDVVPWSAPSAWSPHGGPPVGFAGPAPRGPAPYPAGAGGPGWASPPAPPADGRWRPERIEGVPGTPFGVARLAVQPVTSGLAIGSLLTGLVAVLVSLAVLCFGTAGADDGWGLWSAGAFALLAGAAGLAGVGLGVGGLRQIRRSTSAAATRFTGRGLAIAGLSCAAVGVGITVLALALTVVLQFS